jgi:hypothetical protein
VLTERRADDVETVLGRQAGHRFDVVVLDWRGGGIKRRHAALLEHLLQARGQHEHQRSGPARPGLEGVGQLARAEDQLARAGGELVVAVAAAQLAVQDVEGLVLAVVDVQGWAEVGGEARLDQAGRTRDALIAATRRLLAQGTTPTVEQAAAAAQISRATAYRYFPNQRALLAATYPVIDRRSLLPDPAPADPAARLAAVADAQTQLVLEQEPELRAQLRLALDPDDADRGQLPLRRGRRITWIEEALPPCAAGCPTTSYSAGCTPSAPPSASRRWCG